MQLTINLPERSEQLAINRQRWADVLADPQWADHPYRIELNEAGQIIMSPPPNGWHSSRQGRIQEYLTKLLDGRVLPECPISTSGGVRAADVGWYSGERYDSVRGQAAFETAPEICIEVLSPSNTRSTMETKRHLYFDAGATECWICDLEGRMTYYERANPSAAKQQSTLCPSFPSEIKD